MYLFSFKEACNFYIQKTETPDKVHHRFLPEGVA